MAKEEKNVVLNIEKSLLENSQNNNYLKKINDQHIESDQCRNESNQEIVQFEDIEDELHGFARHVKDVHEDISKCWRKYRNKIKVIFIVLCIIGYFVYFAFALRHSFGDEGSIRLLWMTCLVVLIKGSSVIKGCIGDRFTKKFEFISVFIKKHFVKINSFMLCSIYVAVLIVLILDFTLYSSDLHNLVSLGGMIVYILLLFIFSKDPSRIKWRTVAWGFGLQLVFALIILRWSGGFLAFKWLGDRILDLISFSNSGCIFLFGVSYRDHFFAMQILPIIIVTSSLVTILLYLEILDWLIFKLAWIMETLMGTTTGESVSAAGNVFLGQMEMSFFVKPILHVMTESELHAMMTSGFATIAGGALAAFALFGVPASHLLSASVMSAPAALAVSKLSYPETKKSLTSAANVKSFIKKGPEKSIIEAAAVGATSAVSVVVSIAAVVIAFKSLLQFFNVALAWFGQRVGAQTPFSLEFFSSYVMWPLALLMGIPVDDCRKVAQLIGIRTFVSEYFAYDDLSKLISNRHLFDDHVANNGTWSWTVWKEDILLHHADGNFTRLFNGVINKRSAVISTYALCGFANIGAIAVQLGGFSVLAPSRQSTFSKLALRSLISACVACFVTACIAGAFYRP